MKNMIFARLYPLIGVDSSDYWSSRYLLQESETRFGSTSSMVELVAEDLFEPGPVWEKNMDFP